MSELRSALDGLADIDLAELSDAALLGAVAEWATAANRITAALTRAVRAADRREAHRLDGAVSMKAWLRGSCHLAPAEATALVSTGRRLEQLPATAEAFADGGITATHARVITRAMTPKRLAQAAEAGIDPAETDRILAALARRTTPGDTAQAVARWVAGVDPDGALDDAADVRRRFTMASGLDGRVHLRGDLDAVGGEYVHAALAALMNGDRPVGDQRSHAERQADALVALARGALDGGRLPDVRGERPHVRVTIDWQALSAARAAVGVAGGQLGWAGPDHARDRPPAGLRRLGGPHHHRSGRAAAGRRPGAAHGERGHPAGRRAARRALRLRRLRRPAGVVRRPPPGALGARRSHELRQRRPALRAPPHVLPRGRLHRPAGSRHRPVAHLPP